MVSMKEVQFYEQLERAIELGQIHNNMDGDWRHVLSEFINEMPYPLVAQLYDELVYGGFSHILTQYQLQTVEVGLLFRSRIISFKKGMKDKHEALWSKHGFFSSYPEFAFLSYATIQDEIEIAYMVMQGYLGEFGLNAYAINETLTSALGQSDITSEQFLQEIRFVNGKTNKRGFIDSSAFTQDLDLFSADEAKQWIGYSENVILRDFLFKDKETINIQNKNKDKIGRSQITEKEAKAVVEYYLELLFDYCLEDEHTQTENKKKMLHPTYKDIQDALNYKPKRFEDSIRKRAERIIKKIDNFLKSGKLPEHDRPKEKMLSLLQYLMRMQNKRLFKEINCEVGTPSFTGNVVQDADIDYWKELIFNRIKSTRLSELYDYGFNIEQESDTFPEWNEKTHD